MDRNTRTPHRRPSRPTAASRTILLGAAVAAAGVCAAAVAGCGGEARSGQPLTAEQFAARNGVSLQNTTSIDGGRASGSPVDRGGAVPYDSTERAVPGGPAPTAGIPSAPGPGPAGAPQQGDSTAAAAAVADPNPGGTPKVSQAVKQAVSRPYAEQEVADLTASGQPATRPAAPAPLVGDAGGGPIELTAPPAAAGTGAAGSSGTAAAAYTPGSLDVFFVIMDVNGRAIFSDKVLQLLDRTLAAEARRLDAGEFRKKAAGLIEGAVRSMVKEELEVAAAEKELEPAEKQMAQARTVDWRQRQITAAGGSLELAKRRFASEGWEFDEMAKEQYRLFLVQQFYQRRIFALAQAPAADMRAYYERNKEKEFSSPGRIKFRVIRIDPKAAKYLTREDAFAAADRVRARAATEDFAALASNPTLNDDSLSRDRGGYVRDDGWVQTGSYRFEAVEKALAGLRPGGVTGVVDAEGYLFVAKLEDVQVAEVKPFEDAGVQDRIVQVIKGQQIQALRERHLKSLEAQAVTQRRPGATAQLLDIVMARYAGRAAAAAAGKKEG
jgi:hypothetical protein